MLLLICCCCCCLFVWSHLEVGKEYKRKCTRLIYYRAPLNIPHLTNKQTNKQTCKTNKLLSYNLITPIIFFFGGGGQAGTGRDLNSHIFSYKRNPVHAVPRPSVRHLNYYNIAPSTDFQLTDHIREKSPFLIKMGMLIKVNT